MQSILHVVTPAKTVALVSLLEAKSLLGIPVSDSSGDEQLQFMIDRSSGEIAVFCNNRVFAEETVIETFFQIDNESRLYLARRPVRSESPMIIHRGGVPMLVDTDYILDPASGTLHCLNGKWSAPTVVEYTGGYRLPLESPLALRQAALILARDSYNQAASGTAGGSIRMVSHKDKRVMYHPSTSESGGGKSGGGNGSGMVTANRAVNDILTHFMRFEI